MNTSKQISRFRIFTFLYGFARSFLFPLLLGTLLYASFSVMYPFISSTLLGGATGAIVDGDLSLLIGVVIRTAVVLFLAMFMVYFGILLMVRNEMNTVRRLHIGMLRVFMREGADRKVHSGERLSLLNVDVATASTIYTAALPAVLFSVLPMVIFSITILFIDWRIGLFTMVVGIFSAVCNLLLAKPLAKISKKSLETSAQIAKTLGDIFSGGIIIRVFRLQKRLMKAFGEDNDELKRLVYREAHIDTAQALISGLTQIFTTVGVFVVGSLLISNGDLSIAQLMTVFPLCGALALSFTEIGGAWAGMQPPLEAGQRLYSLLDGNNKVELLKTGHSGLACPELDSGTRQSPATKAPKKQIDPSLEIKGLTFTYPDAEKPVLENIDLSVAAGRFAAILGESGSGKSTLLKVVAGLYGSESAEISVGGTLLSHNDINAWRSYFAYVDQNPTLFNLSVAENIGLGREGATFEEIRAAAVEADADGFISELPNGYDTLVGEVGGSLSGGQRQRIAIARAILRSAPILLLDEVTSALDPESEMEVINTINHLRERHTILFVTHKIHAISPDVVFRIEDGKLVV